MAERLQYEKRQWGEFHVLYERTFADGMSMLTKELVVEAGKGISYQRHFHRDEYWTIVDGEGEIIIEGEKRTVRRGDTAVIRREQLHTIRALESPTDSLPSPSSGGIEGGLTIIETQVGDLLSEDDIERISFPW